MNLSSKVRRVDIDQYFDDLEDPASAASTEPSQGSATASTRLPSKERSLKDRLLGHGDGGWPRSSSPIIPLAIATDGSSQRQFELETAHRAVLAMQAQLRAELSSGLDQPIVTVQSPLMKRQRWRSTPWVVGTLTTLGAVAMVGGQTTNELPTCSQYRYCQVVQHTLLAVWPFRDGRRIAAPSLSATPASQTADEAAFAKSARSAYTAAEMTQTARTSEDWQLVISFWQDAITTLNTIPSSSAAFSSAQPKIREYQANAAYAESELAMAPFRLAVATAEVASELAQSARTHDDWSVIAAKWDEALTLMGQVSDQHERYDVAQQKLAEYATKFAYAQQRYLALQNRQL